MKKGHNVTILDVAKKVGASVSTVSRALNDNPSVSPETKKKISKVADQLGFSLSPRRPGPKPGQAARKKKVAFVNFIDRYYASDDLSSAFLTLQRGVEEGGREKGLSIHLHFIGAGDEELETLEEGGFAGFILLGWKPHASVVEYLKTKPCCWVMNNPWTPTWGDHVMPDHREAGMMALEYLTGHGCRHPVIVKLGRPDRVSALREEGFAYAASKQGIKARSLSVKKSLPEDLHDTYPETAYVDEVIERFRKAGSAADGIFFDCDRAMAVLYPVMVREGIIVPGKTVLIGCNNQQPFLKGISPHPATMEVHFGLIGRMGAIQLAWRIDNQDIYQRLRSMISPELIALS